jgi:division protein CdvB (Snf7/Vps24/ESCRT-III family)
MVAIGTWAYFGLHETLNQHSTRLELMEKDLEENTEFRIKWPRGEMGSLPADSEQFMMLEDLYKTTDKINKHIDSMMNNRINIEFLQKQMDKVLRDIEALKDKNREMYYNGSNGKKNN